MQPGAAVDAQDRPQSGPASGPRASTATTTSVFVYGTTEAPSSMTSNVEDLSGRTVLRAG